MIRTTKTRNAPRTLEPIGDQEMKTVAGGEVGATIAALNAYCASYGMNCTNNGEIANFNYGTRYSVDRF
jgi:hypothetical protein